MLETLSRRELRILLHITLNPNTEFLGGLRICQDLKMGSGTVYPALEKLEQMGLIQGERVVLETTEDALWRPELRRIGGLIQKNEGLVTRRYKSAMPLWILQNVERRWPQMLRKLGIDKIPTIWSHVVRRLGLWMA